VIVITELVASSSGNFAGTFAALPVLCRPMRQAFKHQLKVTMVVGKKAYRRVEFDPFGSPGDNTFSMPFGSKESFFRMIFKCHKKSQSVSP